MGSVEKRNVTSGLLQQIGTTKGTLIKHMRFVFAAYRHIYRPAAELVQSNAASRLQIGLR